MKIEVVREEPKRLPLKEVVITLTAVEARAMYYNMPRRYESQTYSAFVLKLEEALKEDFN